MRKIVLFFVLAALVVAAGGAVYYLQVQQPKPLAVSAQAERQVLLAYFAALRTGRYAEAADLFGGDYEVLVGYNPEIDPRSHAALLEAACTVNGFACHLEPRNVVEVRVSEIEIQFTVEFQNPDGSTFELPCVESGPSECVPRTQLDYTVRREDDQYRVLELPVYVS